ncbi:MAG: hypothetical protein LW836_08280 [Gemmatimonadetes bacterium]|jgi:hypothetical protein|nr:hypothetical protein [Gemmatimonadota bacterium]
MSGINDRIGEASAAIAQATLASATSSPRKPRLTARVDVMVVALLAFAVTLFFAVRAHRMPLTDRDQEHADASSVLTLVADQLQQFAADSGRAASLTDVGYEGEGITHTTTTKGFRLLLVTTWGDTVTLDRPPVGTVP